MAKQKIPCRVCGKLFEPCAYCKAHEDVFRWRNFACSRECAAKYIADTTAYRESLQAARNKGLKPSSATKDITDSIPNVKTATARKKTNKKTSEDIIAENTRDTEENKTE